MPRFSELRIPPPEKGDAFESLCLDLWREVWQTHIELHGRLGQEQRGVDIYGCPDGARGYWGIQCKARGPHTDRKRFAIEVSKDVDAARAFVPPLEVLLVVTTLERDTSLQQLERELNAAETSRGGFRVQFLFWRDVLMLLEGHLSVARKHMPDVFVSATEHGTLLPPKLPPHYFVRTELHQRLRAVLLSETADSSVTGEGTLVLHGMGGIGKSVLAAALAWDMEVKTSFPDGIFWLTVGQKPNLLEILRKLAQALGAGSPSFTDTHGGKNVVRGLCERQRLLLVMDDIWSTHVAEVLDVTGPVSRSLITTRNAEIASFFGATSHQIDLMEDADALTFLSHCSGRPAADLPHEAKSLIKGCGGLPLAIAMIGGMLRGRSPAAWSDALDLLREEKLEDIRRAFPDYPYPDLLRALGVSVDALEPQQRACYLDLAVFEDDVPIPEPTIVMLWERAGLQPPASRRLLSDLKDRSLLRQDTKGRFSLHNLLHDYVRRNVDDHMAVHRRLVDAYRRRSPDGFASGPDDGYFFQWLPVHLAVLGLHEELQKLLTDYAWLHAMLRATDINRVTAAYALLDESQAAEWIQSALLLSSNVLASDPDQLPYQFLGRVSAGSRNVISDLLKQAAQARNPPYLAPRQPMLEVAGGPLRREYTEYAQWMTAVAIVDAERFVSVPLATYLNIRELATGNLLHVLRGHTRSIEAVAVLGNGLVVSGSEDQTVRVWDLETGVMVHVLEGHEGSVKDVAALGEHLVVSASIDKTVRIWDARTGSLLRVYEEHAGQVHHVAVFDDWRVVSADLGDGGGARVWDALSGETIHAVERLSGPMTVIDRRWIVSAHGFRLHIWDTDTQAMWCTVDQTSGSISALVALEGRRVLSGSADGMLRIWDVETGACVQSQRAHGESVNDVDARGTSLVLSASMDATVRAWNLDVDRQRGHQRGYRISVDALATMSERWVAAGSSDGKIYLYDTVNGEREGVLGGHQDVVGLARLDARMLVSVSRDGSLRVWDIEQRSVVGRWAYRRPGRIAVLSPEVIVFGGDDGRLAIINLRSGDVRVSEGHRQGDAFLSKEITAIVTFGERFITAARHSTLRLWSVAAEVPDVSIDTPEEVRSLAVLETGFVVAGTENGNLLVFDMERGVLVRRLNGRAGRWVHTVAAVDHRYVVSCSSRILCVWDVMTGLVAHRFSLDTSANAMCMLNDRRTFVIGDVFGKVSVMDLVVK
jgi:WD40 repeat protein